MWLANVSLGHLEPAQDAQPALQGGHVPRGHHESCADQSMPAAAPPPSPCPACTPQSPRHRHTHARTHTCECAQGTQPLHTSTHLGVSLKGQDVGCNAVQEPAVVGHHQRAAGKVGHGLLQAPGWWVEGRQQCVRRVRQHQAGTGSVLSPAQVCSAAWVRWTVGCAVLCCVVPCCAVLRCDGWRWWHAAGVLATWRGLYFLPHLSVVTSRSLVGCGLGGKGSGRSD